MKQPSLQFYPGDWMKDPTLRSVSLAARGLWIDMLCLMHESPDRGYLRNALRAPIVEAHLARIEGVNLNHLRKYLVELESVGVFSRAEDGAIFSRRMVRDTKLLETRRQCGSLGGNPNLVGKKVNQTANQNPTPSSSSSTSVITPIVPKGDRGTIVEAERRKWFEERFWPIVWAKIGVDAARKAWLREVPDEQTCNSVIVAARRQGPGILERGRRPGSSVLHPATWLNQGRYLDEEPRDQAMGSEYARGMLLA